MRRSVNPLAEDINRRFFTALEDAIARGRCRGLKTFCMKHGLNRTKYSRMRNDLDLSPEDMPYKTIDVDALAALCLDFNVSADWLLTGRGRMLRGGGK